MNLILDPNEFEKRVHREIPLSDAMQVRVESISNSAATLRAPLAPNINHKSTAFGGSVHTLAILSCWSLVTATVKELEDKGYRAEYVVIQDSSIDYKKPVTVDFSARSSWPSAETRDKFLSTLVRRGRARASLTAEVFTELGICARLQARFAAQLVDSPRPR